MQFFFNVSCVFKINFSLTRHGWSSLYLMQLVRQTLSFQLFQNYNFRILDIQTWTEIESIIERHIFLNFQANLTPLKDALAQDYRGSHNQPTTEVNKKESNNGIKRLFWKWASDFLSAKCHPYCFPNFIRVATIPGFLEFESESCRARVESKTY